MSSSSFRWPLLYRWGQAKQDMSSEDYDKLHQNFRELVQYVVLMENTFGKNPYLNVYDWAEVHFWPLVAVDSQGKLRCPDLQHVKPLLCDAIRNAYNLSRYQSNEHPMDETDWQKVSKMK